MFEKGRTKKITLLGFAAIALAIAGVAPAFAWHVVSFDSTIYCNNGTTSSPSWAPCTSSQLSNITTQIEDQATLKLSSVTCNPEKSVLDCFGSVSFYLYKGGSSTYFNNVDTNTCTLGTGKNAPSLIWTDPANPQAVTSTSESSSGQPFTSSTVTGSAGNYFFYVSYSGSNQGYPSASLCEPFSASGTFPPPPTGVPQFPLGMALLLALAIPGLLLIRSRVGFKAPVPAAF